jgi:hypothetical protein
LFALTFCSPDTHNCIFQPIMAFLEAADYSIVLEHPGTTEMAGFCASRHNSVITNFQVGTRWSCGKYTTITA